jgi:hypothetical protein
MPQKHNNYNIIVHINCLNPIFSERLIKLMGGSKVKFKSFELKNKRSDIFIWLYDIWRSKCDIVHVLWGGYNPIIYVLMKALGKKVIVHWIGGDVSLAVSTRKGRFGALRFFVRRMVFKIVDRHLVDFQPLAEELKILGINAQVLSLYPDISGLSDNNSWPELNKVFVYLPETRQEFYGGETIFNLARSLPDVEFLITRNTGETAPHLPNMKFMGFVDDMGSIWKQSKIYVRLTEHDGLSHTVIEALSRGKHVIWSHEYPFCFKASTFEDVKNAIQLILQRDQPNMSGVEYVQQKFSPSKMAEDYFSLYRSFAKRTNIIPLTMIK